MFSLQIFIAEYSKVYFLVCPAIARRGQQFTVPFLANLIRMLQTFTRFALRERTRSAHERLDRIVGSIDSTESYARYLRGIGVFRRAAEARYDAVAAAAISDFVFLPLSDLISADMQDLQIEPAPDIPFELRLETPAEFLGFI